MALKKGEIKVDKSIKPIHFEKRKPIDLNIGETYYVSFGNNVAIPCKLEKIINEGNRKWVSVLITRRDSSSTHSLFADEIGRTPEEAVINEVTS